MPAGDAMNSKSTFAAVTNNIRASVGDKIASDPNTKSFSPRVSGFRPARDHTRTISIAETALAQIKALQLPADPPAFELWYKYVSSENPALNQSINEKLALNGQLSTADIDELYDKKLSPARLGDAIENVGDKLNIEVGQIAKLIGAAMASTTESQRHFEDIGQKLKNPIDPRSLSSIVQSLIFTTKKADEENAALQAKLKASQREIEDLQSNLNIVRIESVTDPLTQLANRKYLDRAFAKAVSDCEQKKEPLSLLLCDIDHFKRFNDSFGHMVGDQVLRLVSAMIKQSIKGQDIAARYGGEEFIILLPNTSLSGARSLGETIRKTVMTKELEKRSTGEKLGRITISIGAAQFHDNDNSEKLVERADKCLYVAKENGRNRVVSEIELSVS